MTLIFHPSLLRAGHDRRHENILSAYFEGKLNGTVRVGVDLTCGLSGLEQSGNTCLGVSPGTCGQGTSHSARYENRSISHHVDQPTIRNESMINFARGFCEEGDIERG